MTIVSTFLRGTPARPHAERVTRISIHEGSVSFASRPSGVDVEIYTSHAGSIRIPLSRDELGAIADTIYSLHPPSLCGISCDHLALVEANGAEEVSAA